MEKAQNSKNSSLLIIVFIFILIIGAALLYLISIRENNKAISDNKPDSRSQKVNKNYAVDVIKYYSYSKSRENGINSFTSDELLRMYLYFAKISNNDFHKESETEESDTIYSVNKSVFDNFYKTIFGPDITVDYNSFVGITIGNLDYNNSISLFNKSNYASTSAPHTSIGCGFTVVGFDNASGKITISVPGGCGDAGYDEVTEDVKENIISTNETSDSLVITSQVLYKYCDESATPKCGYYTNLSKESIINSDEDNKENMYINSGSNATLNFKLNKDTNQYYFVSSTLE